MTAKQLIAKLRKMPPNAEVGFNSHDNCEYELQGWARAVHLLRKEDAENLPENQRQQLDDMPDEWVCVSC